MLLSVAQQPGGNIPVPGRGCPRPVGTQGRGEYVGGDRSWLENTDVQDRSPFCCASSLDFQPRGVDVRCLQPGEKDPDLAPAGASGKRGKRLGGRGETGAGGCCPVRGTGLGSLRVPPRTSEIENPVWTETRSFIILFYFNNFILYGVLHHRMALLYSSEPRNFSLYPTRIFYFLSFPLALPPISKRALSRHPEHPFPSPTGKERGSAPAA